MPKIPEQPAKSTMRDPKRLSIQSLADRLDYVRVQLLAMQQELTDLTTTLYSRGLDDRGPISNDDIPF